jgi:putative glycerol-1-phosphate prenyltransferase/phosphoglycerol geranylgeranyltransferase
LIGKIEQSLLDSADTHGCGWAILLDPDSLTEKEFLEAGARAQKVGADVIFVGGSFMGTPAFTIMTEKLKTLLDIPLVLFPGGASHISKGPDALLFTTLVSGRNPQYLIDEQVRGSVMVQAMGMEAIPTAYTLVDGGQTTAVEYISNTSPIPADQPKISMVTALAANMMGMRWCYLEAGSGAKNPVPAEHVLLVSKGTNMNVICGGGIKTPEAAALRAQAGAKIIVTGNIWEKISDEGLMKSFAQAIHYK